MSFLYSPSKKQVLINQSRLITDERKVVILMKKFILLIAAVLFVFAGATATNAMSKGEKNATSLDIKDKMEAGAQDNSDVKALKKGGKDIKNEAEAGAQDNSSVKALKKGGKDIKNEAETGAQDNSSVKALKKGGKDVKNLDKEAAPPLADKINGGTVK
jgi:hypothetical protein